MLSDGHFTFKNNDILESDRFLYRINMFNGRWLVTVQRVSCVKTKNMLVPTTEQSEAT